MQYKIVTQVELHIYVERNFQNLTIYATSASVV
jgi:hypothetical protein